MALGLTEPRAQTFEFLLQPRRHAIAERGIVLRNVVQLALPTRGIHRKQLLEILRGYAGAGNVQRLSRRQIADRRLDRLAGALHALADPLEHAAVVTVTRPEPLALGVLAKPVHEENLWQLAAIAAIRHGQPVGKVIAHV